MSSINELICDELIYWKFEISSTAQSKNQLNWASCGLDQSIETIQSMGSINNQSTDRYSRWGPPACSNVLAGWASLILPAWRCRQPPCPPAPSTGSSSFFFFASKESKIGAGAEVIGLVLDCKTITQLTLDAR